MNTMSMLTVVIVLGLWYILFFNIVEIKLELGKVSEMLKTLTADTPQAVKAFITFEGKKVEKMDLKVNKNLPVALVLEDKFDNQLPAPATAPTWTLADVAMGELEVAADGMSATFKPSGRLGQTQISALLAESNIQGVLDLNLIAGDVAEVLLQPGAPVDQ